MNSNLINNNRPLLIFIRTLAIVLVFNVLFVFIPFQWGRLSLYNHFIPPRLRFPFAEDSGSTFNLSLSDLDAIFASHEVSIVSDDFRIFVVGDSSVWGMLLRPEETLSTQLDQAVPRACDRPTHFYNLGYPSSSITKDLLLLDVASKYHPDLILWMVTLEAFPFDNQVKSPLVTDNPERLGGLIARYNLPLPTPSPRNFWQRTLWSRRRDLADIIQLQLVGVVWAATGVDQTYPEEYRHAQTDVEDDSAFYGYTKPPLNIDSLAYSTLESGLSAYGKPIIVVNQPMLISNGRNSGVRYNFYYPRWAYDEYRIQLASLARQNNWAYLDLWNLIPSSEFTNSAFHLTSDGESKLAQAIAIYLQNYDFRCK